MSGPPPIGVGLPAFLAVFHLPGLALDEPVLEVVPGIWVQRITWADWRMVAHGGDAERLYREFEQAGHVFLSVNAPDYTGGETGAEQGREIIRSAVLELVTALRLHKSGPLIDPRFSQQYLRVGSLNVRIPGPYGARLLEYPQNPRYLLNTADLADLAVLHRNVVAVAQIADPGIALALRAFGFSYGYGLTVPQRLAYLFVALEAVFGEYRKQNRPTPRVTLGAVAAMVSREDDTAALQAFLDDAQAARRMRNAVAHGDISGTPTASDPVVPRLEDIVRDGLRALIAFAAEYATLQPHIEAIETGMGALPPKAAFQKLLSHAAKDHAMAKAMTLALMASYP